MSRELEVDGVVGGFVGKVRLVHQQTTSSLPGTPRKANSMSGFPSHTSSKPDNQIRDPPRSIGTERLRRTGRPRESRALVMRRGSDSISWFPSTEKIPSRARNCDKRSAQGSALSAARFAL